ncbi:FAD-binding oxidoreductase [Noviherbaspirillum sedimenti]|uniref:FAD-binding oxidoreductase n=1 Tax=Noviherbaspirillum sedimenti TaxID=2320865 RepID=A0A3A3GMX5_9BURK|nr:FAD-binding oxidoreductase [Noviherbaspirillum sedimenti]RJG03646.1 FAD-binding oxidoreductase [Noviherbaspirillum sedimenti]
MNPDILIERFLEIVGDRGVITDPADLEHYCTDWRGVFKGKAMCVVLPQATAQVAAVVRLCAAENVPLVPHGGNTGLSGGATPDDSGQQVILSLSRMAAIRSIDGIGETMEVEAGCILQVAQEAAAESGMLLPISLAAEGSAKIGGILSTNAGGTNVLRYGMARGRVLGLEVVTAEGEIVNGLRQLRKDNAGYDWKQLFIGTEGTLGIITAAVLQLAPMPRHKATAFIAVDSPEDALKVLRAARQEIGEALNAFELMSGPSVDLVVRHLGIALPVGAAPWYVLLEATSSLGGLREGVEQLFEKVFEREEASDGVIAESERQEMELWSIRESITECESRAGRSVKHDVSVPISSIPSFLQVASEAVERAFPNVRVNAFGHAGDGNMHFNVIVPPETDALALNRLVHDLVVQYGGSISAEHGIGQYRVGELVRCRSEPELKLAVRVKRALDPRNLLNPGKVLPAFLIAK